MENGSNEYIHLPDTYVLFGHQSNPPNAPPVHGGVWEIQGARKGNLNVEDWAWTVDWKNQKEQA